MEQTRFLEIAAGPWTTTVTGEYLNWGSAPDAAEFKAAQDEYFGRDSAKGWHMHPDEHYVALLHLLGREPTYLEVYTSLFSPANVDAWWRIDPAVFDANGIPTNEAWVSWSWIGG